MITMENGASIMLESSWALNSLEVDEAKVTLCGTKGGADMKDGLRFNGEHNSRLYVNKVDMEAGGVASMRGSPRRLPMWRQEHGFTRSSMMRSL